jgi:hypothetical protein
MEYGMLGVSTGQANKSSEHVTTFKYFQTTVTNQNYIQEELRAD